MKLKEFKLFDANISKVVRTTRNDFVFGTSDGVQFFRLNQNHEFESSPEPPYLAGKDITEVSEFSHDRFVVGLWNENDFLLINRNEPNGAPEKL